VFITDYGGQCGRLARPAARARDDDDFSLCNTRSSCGCRRRGEDNPAVCYFLSMLPLTLTLEEFAGREKIAYLPRELAHAGSPGSDPEDGDLNLLHSLA
jgi:hypothetical protein